MGKMKYLLMASMALAGMSVTVKAESLVDVALPEAWSVYGPVPCVVQPQPDSDVPASGPLPGSLCLGNRVYPGIKTKAENGMIDLMALFTGGVMTNTIRTGDWAYLAGVIHCDKRGTVLIGTGADWWMQWVIDGKPVFDTLATGNETSEYSISNHVFRVRLEKGDHTVCVLVKSGSAGWRLAAGSGARYRKQLVAAEKKQGGRAREAAKALARLQETAKTNSHMKLVIYGSSVASGAGATDYHGWAYRLKTVLEKRNWTVVNKSIGGDSTTKLLARFNRDLLPEKPDVVIIALSLTNEGVMQSPGEAFASYAANLRKLVQMCRHHGIVPIISNAYPNNAYTPTHYDLLRKFNDELNSWPVASLDFMGTVDDGEGHWQAECWKDGAHPNELGHEEMFHAIPPSLFDALIDATGSLPPPGNTWMRVTRDPNVATAPLKCHTRDPMHSFSVAVTVMFLEVPRDRAVVLAVNDSVVAFDAGRVVYEAEGGGRIEGTETVEANRPFHLVLTYSHANRQTRLWLDGKQVGSLSQQMIPVDFFLGGSQTLGGRECLLRNFLLYRSCLNGDQVMALAQGRILRSSLDLYAPLWDRFLVAGFPLFNAAPTAAALDLVQPQCRVWP